MSVSGQLVAAAFFELNETVDKFFDVIEISLDQKIRTREMSTKLGVQRRRGVGSGDVGDERQDLDDQLRVVDSLEQPEQDLLASEVVEGFQTGLVSANKRGQGEDETAGESISGIGLAGPLLEQLEDVLEQAGFFGRVLNVGVALGGGTEHDGSPGDQVRVVGVQSRLQDLGKTSEEDKIFCVVDLSKKDFYKVG